MLQVFASDHEEARVALKGSDGSDVGHVNAVRVRVSLHRRQLRCCSAIAHVACEHSLRRHYSAPLDWRG
jgi:hypothetical protein